MIPHLGAAYSLARWLTRSDSDADDIVQDAYLRAYRSFDGFRGGDARPWLFAIVRNCHRTWWARNRSGSEVPLADEIGDDANGAISAHVLMAGGDDPETALIRSNTAASLVALLGTLPVEYREVLVLREFEDLSYRDIATIIGSPIGTVMSRLARGRAMLRQLWLAHSGEKVGHGVP